MLLDAQTRQMAQFENVPVDPIEQFLSLEEFQMRETAVYEPVVQPNELVNDYDGPVCRSRRFFVGLYVDFRSAAVR